TKTLPAPYVRVHPRGKVPPGMCMGFRSGPQGWTRTYGAGKVFVLLLGHNGRSFQTPEFQRMVLNGLDWATA
ncbi:MAG TPA: ThuA domain-containing protein, partial [Candidatus Tectomicrobia bacterium]|nr:ThuA domain-containing protein [Candidatus Tectomicrobia bacterium]